MKDMKMIVDETLKVLKEGGIILYPTDTIWGLGCDATNPEAVAKIYEIKHRSDSKALVLLASDMDMICRFVKVIPDIAVQLVEVNDRPMTLIYPGAIHGKAPAEGEKAVADRHFLAYNAVAEDESVGIRIPSMEFCQNLIYSWDVRSSPRQPIFQVNLHRTNLLTSRSPSNRPWTTSWSLNWKKVRPARLRRS